MSEPIDDSPYSNIREIMGSFIGRTILEITQHDEDEWQENHQSYVQLHFGDGSWLKFYIGDEGPGLVIHEEDGSPSSDPLKGEPNGST